MENNGLFDFEFDKKEKCWSVTGYYGKSEEVIFPASYRGKQVKKIVDLFSPNQKKRIKRVIIPEGYTSIGESAFIECTGFTEIKLPESLTSIGESAFKGCTGLTEIKLPKSRAFIGDSAFEDCKGLTSIELPKSLTSIGNWTFKNCKRLTSIKLPESLTSIGEEAFGHCKGLTNIKLPKSLTSFGDRVFADCTGLTEITVDKDNPAFCAFDGAIFDKAMTTLILAPIGTKGVYSVPDGIVSIDSDAFGDKCKLTGISFPKSLQYIDHNIDHHLINNICEHLATITVSELNPVCCSIDGVLFDKDMSRLIIYPRNKGKTDYVIPDGVQYIDNCAFYGCKRLVNIVLPDSIRFIGDNAFAECKRLKTITLSNKLRHAMEFIIGNRINPQNMLLPGNLIIKHYAFGEFKGQFIYRD